MFFCFFCHIPHKSRKQTQNIIENKIKSYGSAQRMIPDDPRSAHLRFLFEDGKPKMGGMWFRDKQTVGLGFRTTMTIQSHGEENTNFAFVAQVCNYCPVFI